MRQNAVEQGVYLYAYNVSGPVEDNQLSLTAVISKDGGDPVATTTTNPTQIGGGFYWLPLIQEEVNCDSLLVIPTSVTAGVTVTPVISNPSLGGLNAGVNVTRMAGRLVVRFRRGMVV